MKYVVFLGAFHLGKKPEISVGAKVEFPIGKKLFHLVSTPVRGRVPDGGPGTGTNYEKRKWNNTAAKRNAHEHKI